MAFTDGPPGRDLVVLSHLRWAFVWQRPQHLISRITGLRAGGASATRARTWFVEEPWAKPDVDAPQLGVEQHGDVTRVWLEVPVTDETPEGRLDFAIPAAADYPDLLAELLADRPEHPHVWLYTPMALDIAEALEPGGRSLHAGVTGRRSRSATAGCEGSSSATYGTTSRPAST